MAKPGPPAGFPRISHPKKRAVLLAYSETMRIGPACTSAGITPRMHRYWLHDDPDYAQAFQEAKDLAAAVLEDEAVRRAREGVTQTIFHHGAPIGTAQVYSDTLLIFLLKGAKPETYREQIKLDVAGTVRLETALQQGLKRLEVLRDERRHSA